MTDDRPDPPAKDTITTLLQRLGADRAGLVRSIAAALPERAGDRADEVYAAVEHDPQGVACVAAMNEADQSLRRGDVSPGEGRAVLVRLAATLAEYVSSDHGMESWFRQRFTDPAKQASLADLVCLAIGTGWAARRGRAPSVRTGRLIVVTGEGKGKTTSALGLALRAIGSDMRVLIVQFIKGAWKPGEMRAARRLAPDLEIRPTGRGFVRAEAPEGREADRRLAQAAWEQARRDILSGRYHVVVLDEIFCAVEEKLLDAADVHDFLERRPSNIHLVLTGRHAPKEFIDLADTATEMVCLKHALDRGVKATRGIEF